MGQSLLLQMISSNLVPWPVLARLTSLALRPQVPVLLLQRHPSVVRPDVHLRLLVLVASLAIVADRLLPAFYWVPAGQALEDRLGEQADAHLLGYYLVRYAQCAQALEYVLRVVVLKHHLEYSVDWALQLVLHVVVQIQW